jgi:hypothetical protein
MSHVTAAELLSESIRRLERLETSLPDVEYWNGVRRRAAALSMSLAIFLPDVEDLDNTINPPRPSRRLNRAAKERV